MIAQFVVIIGRKNRLVIPKTIRLSDPFGAAISMWQVIDSWPCFGGSVPVYNYLDFFNKGC